MAHSTDIVGYSFQADIYCPECILDEVEYMYSPGLSDVSGASMEKILDALAELHKIDRHNESSFDSGEFPKIILREHLNDWLHEYDNGYGVASVSPAHCGSCSEVLGD